jgi:hypothetical protein
MRRFAEVARRIALPFVLFVIGAAVFEAAYCQAPLYYSNQNQYFLHGLAHAGYGELGQDWLAKTRDSTPLFSGLVAFTYRYFHPWAFYLDHALLLGVYGAAMLGLFVSIAGDAARRRWPVFVALFITAHAALLRWGSYRLFGQDYPWFLQSGLAGQYTLGGMFQPSMFGVLLVVAVCMFVRGRPYLAAAIAALAAVIHPTYLLSAGFVVLGIITALLAERRVLQALGAGALALALVLPAGVHVLLTFGPTSPSQFADAQSILVNIRIPHHSRPDLWFDAVAAFQIIWLVVGIALARPVRLLYVLAVPSLLALALTLLALALTLAQVKTGSNTLALLFPWRVTCVLVPIATTVILSRLAAVGYDSDRPIESGTIGIVPHGVSAIVVVLLAIGGLWISTAGSGFHSSDEELPLLAFARQSRAPGQVYLLPVHVPDLVKSTHGSVSSDFKPIADKKQDARIIPVDLQRFRLGTGVPIYVDFKSIPYKDVEVLEWERRLGQNQRWQERIRDGGLREVLPELRAEGVTHLVVPAGLELDDSAVERIFDSDETYWVYRLNNS